MGALHDQSRYAATVEELCAPVEDTKTAHPDLSVVVPYPFHAMGASPGYGNQTTAEMANRAMALKALGGRCDLDILFVAQCSAVQPMDSFITSSQPLASRPSASQGPPKPAPALPPLDPPLAALLSLLLHCGEPVRARLAAQAEGELMCILDALVPEE